MSKITKRYIVSSLVTFASAFCLAILPVLDNLDVENLSKSAIFAVIFAGLRAGIKALIEFLFVKE